MTQALRRNNSIATMRTAGGWNSFHGFNLKEDSTTGQYTIEFPGDPAMKELSRTRLRDEIIVLFEYSWVAIIQADKSYDIARMD